MEQILEKEAGLLAYIKGKQKIAIAFSGGVDSAYLLYCAVKSGVTVQAYYVKSDFQPAFELEDAKKLCEQLSVPMVVIPVEVLSDKTIEQNPANRCYYCKRLLFAAILEHAAADGYQVICDGTNASDDAADRPGMTALQELSVISPLRICGLTKDEIRSLSHRAGLFTWDKPAYACLATRIPSGMKIEKAMLEKTEAAEEVMKALGFHDFRVRMTVEGAKLQIRTEQFPLLLQKREEIRNALKPYYSRVLVDLEGRE